LENYKNVQFPSKNLVKFLSSFFSQKTWHNKNLPEKVFRKITGTLHPVTLRVRDELLDGGDCRSAACHHPRSEQVSA
jgi:hypothetical protein